MMKKTQKELLNIYKSHIRILLLFLFFNCGNFTVNSEELYLLPPVFFKNFDLDDYHASCQNWDLCISPKGSLYVANNTGLLVFDGNNWKLYKLPDKSAVLNVTFSSDTLYSRSESSVGYWLVNETGLLSYTPLNEQPPHIHFYQYPDIIPYHLPKEILDSHPSAFASLNNVNYTGTSTNGLYVTDSTGKILTHVTDQSLLQDNIINRIYTDFSEQIWIAFDNGLSQINLNPPMRFLGKRNKLGLLDDAILHDNELYIHTNIGYHKRSLQTGTQFEPVSEKEAFPYFQGREIKPSLRLEDIFSTLNGLEEFSEADQIYHAGKNLFWLTLDNEAALFAKEEKENKLQCRLLFDNYNLNLVTRGQRFIPLNDSLYVVSTMQGVILLNTKVLIRKNNANKYSHYFSVINYTTQDNSNYISCNTSKITLPHNFQSLNIYVGSTIFTPNNHLSFMLENVSTTWSPWQESGNISFLQLPEGKYKLRVRKYVSTGNFPEITLMIEVRPPWYNTLWAYVLYIVFIWAILQTTIFYHLKNVKKEEKQQKEQQKREEQERLQAIKHEILESELINKSNELMLQTSLLVRKSNLIHSFLEELVRQKETLGERYPNKMYIRLKKMMEDSLNDETDWNAFENYFNSAHQNFIVRLRHEFSDITNGDLKICCLLRMNLSTKEIASILNISVRAVELRRYRLRKRMGLTGETNLVDFLINF